MPVTPMRWKEPPERCPSWQPPAAVQLQTTAKPAKKVLHKLTDHCKLGRGDELAALAAELLQVPFAMSRLEIQRLQNELQRILPLTRGRPAVLSASACCDLRPLECSSERQSRCHPPPAELETAILQKPALIALQTWTECKYTDGAFKHRKFAVTYGLL